MCREIKYRMCCRRPPASATNHDNMTSTGTTANIVREKDSSIPRRATFGEQTKNKCSEGRNANATNTRHESFVTVKQNGVQLNVVK